MTIGKGADLIIQTRPQLGSDASVTPTKPPSMPVGGEGDAEVFGDQIAGEGYISR